jgi:hypothetical protein
MKKIISLIIKLKNSMYSNFLLVFVDISHGFKFFVLLFVWGYQDNPFVKCLLYLAYTLKPITHCHHDVARCNNQFNLQLHWRLVKDFGERPLLLALVRKHCPKWQVKASMYNVGIDLVLINCSFKSHYKFWIICSSVLHLYDSCWISLA